MRQLSFNNEHREKKLFSKEIKCNNYMAHQFLSFYTVIYFLFYFIR